ncbi:hypothetical protein Bca52824_019547 [Brassica carinata]|uniref:Uncharacterized protein n=1 Tax=Brassica carinata TaxID=52824 RepID=A0A8X7VT91_BRACI|nr:hypothetical protein Bca52824_019547 [Brassica carinata]
MDDDDDDDGETKNPLCITWKSNVKSGPMTKNEIKRHLGLAKADKVETDKSRELKGDLDTKLHIAEAKLNETQKKLSSLEVEFDYRKSCCEELEGTCIELQLQLESVETKKPMRRNKSMAHQGQSSNGKEEIPDAAKLRTHPLTDLDRLDRLFGGKHISTDDGYYPGSGVDRNTESETVTENECDTVNLEDDSDVPSRNQNETPSSYNQSSKRVYGNTSRSSSSARKRRTTKASYDFVTNEAYMKQTEL